MMTKVYGVTPYGAQKQIKKHLIAQGTDLDYVTIKQAAAYLSQKLAETMTTMFQSSTEIQVDIIYWLILCIGCYITCWVIYYILVVIDQSRSLRDRFAVTVLRT